MVHLYDLVIIWLIKIATLKVDQWLILVALWKIQLLMKLIVCICIIKQLIIILIDLIILIILIVT